ncbi:MAG: 50S ribosomal protein L15 [Defluviitaleaceae bacterium]|nr:50S ribosomal protein L15 [Defluviitaleaceae bacterium]
MLELSNLKPAPGSNKKKFRVGRGHGSGSGKTSGKGHKGQNARSGGGVRRGFEGGQMPLYRRLPKRGFTNRNTKDIVAINLSHLNVFEDGQIVDVAALKSKGLLSNPRDGVKILGNGELSKKLTIKVDYFSKTAIEKINAAGGQAEIVKLAKKLKIAKGGVEGEAEVV